MHASWLSDMPGATLIPRTTPPPSSLTSAAISNSQPKVRSTQLGYTEPGSVAASRAHRHGALSLSDIAGSPSSSPKYQRDANNTTTTKSTPTPMPHSHVRLVMTPLRPPNTGDKLRSSEVHQASSASSPCSTARCAPSHVRGHVPVLSLQG